MTDSSTVESQPFSTRTLHLAFLLICGCLLLLLGLADVGLTDRDEGSNAGAAREMLETGDWISPTLNYEPRYAKPAGTYWITAGIYALFGVNDFTARLQSAIFGLALLVLQYLFLHRLLGPALAFCGSLVLLLNVEFVGIHRMVLTDPALVFFTTLATYGFWLGFCDSNRTPRFLWMFYLGMALGTLAKGPVGVLIPLLGVAPYLTLTRQWKRYFAEGRPLLGWTLCVLIAAPWYLVMLSIHGSDYLAAAQANTTGRFANPMEGHGGTLLFYVPVLLLGFFPWSGLLPAALWHSIKEWKSFRTGTTDPRGEDGLLLFCALWVSGIFLFFTLSATRLPHYVLPLYPPAALLVAVLWSRFLKNTWPSGLTVSKRIVLVTGYLFSIALCSVPLIYANARDHIAVHFPAAAKIGVGVTPIALGVLVFLGVAIFRHLVREEARRPQAFWVLSGMMGLFLLVVILFALPRFGKYFVNPPQKLATIAGFNLGPEDTLIHYGRKLPSLTFYAERKVQFINPGDHQKFFPHLKKDGRVMVILPANLREHLPHPVDSFTPILQRYGFLLLSRDPMVDGTPES
ncbi:MAG: glycosyltransferase family 39 protein [Nitrospira sp.]|nr:glycosyltransferase family 39 protein [Nitrospira sp.]